MEIMENNRTQVELTARRVLDQVRSVVVGKDHVLLWVLAAILAKGHILLEDIPGVGKTTMAVSFSKTLGLQHNRVQFTPDVLPSDITGYSVINQQTGQMVYQNGAVLCNLFLADELNRATSRTQSALLEAMEEGQVTVDGMSHQLPRPFIVIATQNPTGAAGTQLLPDSQLDRFMIRLSLGYPDPADEVNMVINRQGTDPLKALQSVLSPQEVEAMQELVASTFISEDVVKYVVTLIGATRENELLLRGASPRATLAVIAMSKAVAQLRGRDYVIPRDVLEVFLHVVTHRIQLSPKAEGQGLSEQQVLQEILKKVAPPKVR